MIEKIQEKNWKKFNGILGPFPRFSCIEFRESSKEVVIKKWDSKNIFILKLSNFGTSNYSEDDEWGEGLSESIRRNIENDEEVFFDPKDCSINIGSWFYVQSVKRMTMKGEEEEEIIVEEGKKEMHDGFNFMESLRGL